jgi:hypothetical protein
VRRRYGCQVPSRLASATARSERIRAALARRQQELSERRERRRHFVGVVGFLLLGAVLAVSSKLTLVDATAPALTGGITIHLQKQAGVVEDQVGVVQSVGADGVEDLSIGVQYPKSLPSGKLVKLVVSFPSAVKFVRCERENDSVVAKNCRSEPAQADDFVGVSAVVITARTFKFDKGSIAEIDFDLKLRGAVGLNVSNGRVAGQLLHVDGQTSKTQTFTIFQVKNADRYEWSGRTPDYRSATAATWFEERAESGGPPVPVSAVHDGRESSEQLRTFIAGALVGTAGAAVIAAMQEGLPLLRLRRRRGRTRTSLKRSLRILRGPSEP